MINLICHSVNQAVPSSDMLGLIYATELPIRKVCNFVKLLNNVLKGMDWCMHVLYHISIKSHVYDQNNLNCNTVI